MERRSLSGLLALAWLAGAPRAEAQLQRRRDPSAASAPAERGAGVARDPRFPYAGLWRGTRTMPIGSDEIAFRFTVAGDRYAGQTLHADGASAPQDNLVATAGGLTWEQPNSGGGTWLFHVRLAGPDSLSGTLVLRDAPPQLMPPPMGTLVLKRQPPAGGNG